MQFMAALRRKTERFSEAEFAALAEAEAECARSLYRDGAIRQIWSRGDVGGACLLLEVADEAAARALISTLPFYAADMLELAVLIPLSPYRGFGPRG